MDHSGSKPAGFKSLKIDKTIVTSLLPPHLSSFAQQCTVLKWARLLALQMKGSSWLENLNFIFFFARKIKKLPFALDHAEMLKNLNPPPLLSLQAKAFGNLNADCGRKGGLWWFSSSKLYQMEASESIGAYFLEDGWFSTPTPSWSFAVSPFSTPLPSQNPSSVPPFASFDRFFQRSLFRTER